MRWMDSTQEPRAEFLGAQQDVVDLTHSWGHHGSEPTQQHVTHDKMCYIQNINEKTQSILNAI